MTRRIKHTYIGSGRSGKGESALDAFAEEDLFPFKGVSILADFENFFERAV